MRMKKRVEREEIYHEDENQNNNLYLSAGHIGYDHSHPFHGSHVNLCYFGETSMVHGFR